MNARRVTTFVVDTPALDLGRLVELLGAAGVEFGPESGSIRTILDTFDGRLHRAGVRCETHAPRRSGPFEMVVTDRGGEFASVPVTSLVPSADERTGLVAERLSAVVRDRVLESRLTIVAPVQRGALHGAERNAVASVELFGPGRAGAGPLTPSGKGWHETPAMVEVSLLGAGRRPVRPISAALRAAGLSPVDTDVIDHAMRLCGVAPEGLSTVPCVPLAGDLPADEGVRVVLAHLTDTIGATWAGTAGDRDIEYLHEFRIAVRRARTVLGACRNLLPSTLGEEGSSLFGSLSVLTGPPRDLDVMVTQWGKLTGSLDSDAREALEPLRALVVERRREAHHHLTTGLRARSVRHRMDQWRAHLTAPFADLDCGPVGAEIERRIRRAHRRLVAHGRSIDADSPAEQLHALRKDAKRVRYLIECFASLLDPKSRQRYSAQLRGLQENLGDFQDREVQASMIREFAQGLDSRPVDSLLASGYLIALLDTRRVAARAAFAGRFGSFDTASTRTTFDRMFRPHR